MRKRFLSGLLALILCVGMASQVKASAAEALSAQQVYQAMIALKDEYPEGMRWTNDNYYGWKGGIYTGGYGCAGFAFMLSDAAFGSLPARKLTQFTFSDVRVGDILRVNGDTHSVIVLEVYNDYVVVAEGNYNNSVHWGRKLTASEVFLADYMMTRYPDGSAALIPDLVPDPVPDPTPDPTPNPTPDPIPDPTPNPTPAPIPDPTPNPTPDPVPDPTPDPVPVPDPVTPPVVENTFTDVPDDEFFTDAVLWAVAGEITNGTSDTAFSPYEECTQAQILTFLWRAAGEPVAAGELPFVVADAYRGALLWANDMGMIDPGTFDPNAACTRSAAVRFICQAFAVPYESPVDSGFTDVDADADYAYAVAWAVENGVTNGTTETTFSPNEVCNRGQIVTFLHRAYVEEARLTVE